MPLSGCMHYVYAHYGLRSSAHYSFDYVGRKGWGGRYRFYARTAHWYAWNYLSAFSACPLRGCEEGIIDHRQRNENCLSRIKGLVDTTKLKGVYPLFTAAVLWDLFVYLLSNGLLRTRLGTIHGLEAGTVLSFFIREAPRPRFPPSVIMRPKNDDD